MANYESTIEHQVAMEVYSLGCAVSEVWRLRLNPLTADLILREEGSLRAALGTLSVLVEDIRASNDKVDLVAPSLVAAE